MKTMLTVFLKEVRENLRDRRTVLNTLLTGPLLAPLMFVLLINGIVSRELDIRTVDTISVKSYDNQSQAAAMVLKAPDATLMGDGTGILIVDDLVDTGKTLALVREMYPKAHFATVYAKPKGRSMVDTYITEVSQDTWIYFPWDLGLSYVEPIAKGHKG